MAPGSSPALPRRATYSRSAPLCAALASCSAGLLLNRRARLWQVFCEAALHVLAAGQLDANVDFLKGYLCGPLFARGGVLGLALSGQRMVLSPSVSVLDNSRGARAGADPLNGGRILPIPSACARGFRGGAKLLVSSADSLALMG